MLYGYPEVGRFGLGHSMVAWARCVIWCEEVNAKMLAPHWFRLRIGPYLRGERDKRAYARLFRSGHALGGALRDWHLLRAARVSSPEGVFEADISSPEALEQLRKRPTVVQFENARARNVETFFDGFIGHAPLLKARFEAMLKPRHHPTPAQSPHIALHVRMGDFSIARSEADLLVNNTRLPLEWYGDALNTLRKELRISSGQPDLPAVLYSDGSDDELAPLLALAGVQRPPKASAATDMLALSQASCLIGSGSGFSMWGAFFGQVPSVFYRGRQITRIHTDPDDALQWRAKDPIPAHFLHRVSQRAAALSAPG